VKRRWCLDAGLAGLSIQVPFGCSGFVPVSAGGMDLRCLTARNRTPLEKLVLRHGLEVARRDFREDHVEHVDGVVCGLGCKR
jgi:hypothetical protein